MNDDFRGQQSNNLVVNQELLNTPSVVGNAVPTQTFGPAGPAGYQTGAVIGPDSMLKRLDVTEESLAADSSYNEQAAIKTRNKIFGRSVAQVFAIAAALMICVIGIAVGGVLHSGKSNPDGDGNSTTILSSIKGLSSGSSGGSDDNSSLTINRNTIVGDGHSLKTTGDVLIQSSVNSATAFRIQNAAGDNLLVADTKAGTVTIKGQLISSGNLQVGGDIISTKNAYGLSDQGLSLGGVLVCTSKGCIGVSQPAASQLDTTNFARLSANQTFSGSNSFSSQIQATSGVNVNTAYSVGGTAGASFSCTSGQLLQQGVVQGGIITSGSCVNGAGASVSTLQESYDASIPAQIVLSSASGVLQIQDAASPLLTNLFEVDNNGGSTKYFAVNNLGVSVTGSVNATTQYQIGGVQISSANLSNNANLAKLNTSQTFTGDNSFHLASTAFSVQDAASPLGADLFTVTNNGGGTKYFEVSATGVKINGNDVCTTSGNCAGVAGIGGSGTLNKIPIFTGTGLTIGDSILAQSGSTVTATGNLNVTGQYQINGSQIASTDLSDSANLTKQGNTFNGASQLVQTTAGGLLPALSGINLTNLNATNITGGTLNDLRLSNNVTLEGNTFNGASQLVQTTNLGFFPALNGSLITNIAAGNISSGTLNDARLSTNVALLNANQTFSGNNTFSSAITTTAVQPSGSSLLLGTATTKLDLQGDLTSGLTGNNGGNKIKLGFAGTPTGNVNYNLDAAATPGTYTICTTIGNCAGVGGGVTTIGGTTNKLSKFTGSASIGDSSISDNGTSVVVQEGSNSTTAFQIQNAAGNSNLLIADTTNTRVGIGKAPSLATLDVNGTIYQSGNQVCDTSGNCAGVGGQIGGSGTTNTIALFTGSGTIGDSHLAQSGSTITATGNLNVTGQYQVGGSQISSSNLSNDANLAKLNGTQSFSGGNTFTGAFVAQNASNSTTAFQIQNAAGSSNLLVADTTNTRIGIAALPAYTLDVGGDINVSAGSYYRINGVAICGPSATCAPSANSNYYVQNGVTLQANANFNIQSVSLGSVVGIVRGASGQTADLFQAQDGTGANVFKVGATGAVLAQNTTNSTSAFQIQNAAGTSNLLVADTTNSRIGFGAAPANAVVTIGTNTTNSTGGIIFGTDTSAVLYRSGAGRIQTDGQFSVGTQLYAGDIRSLGGTIFLSTNTTLASGATLTVQSAGEINTGNLEQRGIITRNSGPVTFQQAYDGVELAAKAEVGQTADLFQLQDSSGNIQSGFKANGQLYLGRASALTGNATFYNAAGSGNIQLQAANPSSSSYVITLPAETGTICTTAASAACTSVYAGSSGSGSYIQNGTSPQTADYNITGNGTIGGSLKLTGSGTRPSSPTAGQLYYDTTTNQLIQYNGTKWVSGPRTATEIVAAGSSSQIDKDSADYVGNGTNDETAINSAISALPSSGGSVVLLDGTYNIGSTVSITKPNVTLTGSGANTILKRMYDESAANTGGVISITAPTVSVTNVVVTNLQINGNKATYNSANDYGIFVNSMGCGSFNAKTEKITGNWLNNTAGYGIYMYNFACAAIQNNSITNNIIGSAGTTGIYTDSALYETITGNTSSSNGAYGIYTAAGANIQITNNITNSNTTGGIAIDSGTTTVSNNTVKSNGTYGITIVGFSGSQNSVTSNILDSNGIGVYVNAGNNNHTISDNTIYNSTNQGIKVDCGTPCSNIVISNNNINTSGQEGILFNNTVSNSLINGNNLVNNTGSGSASSITLCTGATCTNNQIVNNTISDAAGTGYAINVVNGCCNQVTSNTYLSNNTYSGTGATAINNTGTGTIFDNQLDSNGNIILRSQAGIGLNVVAPSYSIQGAGALVLNGLATPGAPTVAAQGTAGSTTWGYEVTAYDGLGETLASTETQIANGNATLTSSNYNLITPARVSGAVSYKVYRTTAGGTPNTTGLIGTIAGAASTFSLSDTGLTASSATPATNTTGQVQGLGYSALFKNSTDSTTAFQVQNASGTSLLSADTTNMRVGVDVTYAALAVPASPAASVPSNNAIPTVTPTGGTGSTTYGYIIVANISQGTSAASTGGNTNSGVANLTSSSYNALSWTAYGGATSYNVYRTTGGTSQGLIGISYTNSFNDTGIAASTSTGSSDALSFSSTYRYEVTAVDAAGGETTPSAEVFNTTGASNQRRINISWTTSTGAYAYKVYRTAAGGATGTEVYLATVNTNYFTDNGSITAGSATPPTSSTAYKGTNNSNNNLQVTVGGNGTPTGQLYVSGTLPSAPLSILNPGSNARELAVQGKTAVVMGNSYNIYDVSNPAAPTALNSSLSSCYNGGGFHLAYQGNYLYCGRGSSLTIINLANPSTPTTVSTTTISNTVNGISSIYVSGHYLYASIQNYGLVIYDVSNPAAPFTIGQLNTTGSGSGMIYVSGNYAYLSDSSNHIWVINIANPASPALASTVPVGSSSDANALTVVGRYLYVANASSNNIQIIDVSDPLAPSIVSTFSTGASSAPGSLTVQGRYAYVALSGSSAIDVVDVSNPTTPFAVGTIPTISTPGRVAVAGRYMYVVANSASFEIFDLGGTYSQSLEAGAAEFGTVNVDSTANFASDTAIGGNLNVAQSLQTAGNLSAGGNLFVQGSTSFVGGILGGTTISSLATPATPTVTPVGTAGSTSYSYTITAVSASGGETLASPAGSTATGNATLTSSNYNHIVWTPVTGAISYKVYRTVAAGTSPVTTGLIGTPTSNAFNDTNIGGSGSSPTVNTTGNFTVNGSNAIFKPTTDNTTAFQVQNSSAVNVLGVDTSGGQAILGTASSLTGKLAFNTSTGANNITIVGPTSNPTGNYTITIPTITGNANLCVDTSNGNSVCSGYAAASGSGAYVQLAPSSAQTDSSTTNSSIFINKTNGSGTPNLLELQKSASDVFVVGNTGNITASGTYNTNTFNSNTLQFGAGGTATVDSASGQTLQIGTGANAHNITIGNGTGTTAVSVLCGTGTCGFGNNATDHSTLLGSTNGVSQTIIQSGTGAIILSNNTFVGNNNTFTADGQAVFSDVTNATNAFQIQNAAGAQIVDVDTSTGAGVVNVGSFNAANTSFPTTQVLDNFNRANTGPPPSAGWSQGPFDFTAGEGLQLSSNAVIRKASGNFRQDDYWNAGNFGPDSEVYTTITTRGSTDQIGLYLRGTSIGSGTSNGYYLNISEANGASNWGIQSITAGATSNINSFTQAVASGDSVGFSVRNNNLIAWYKAAAGSWVQVGAANSSTYSAAGKIGIGIGGTGGTVLDNFGGGTSGSGFSIDSTGRVTSKTLTDSTTAFQIQNAGGTSNLFIADTLNSRVGIGATPANALLTIGTNSSTISGGIYFGSDTTLYRLGSNNLATSGDFSSGNDIYSRVTSSNQTKIGQIGPGGEGGIAIGSSNDTRLYRSAVNSLKTDSYFTQQNSSNSSTAFQIQNAGGTNLVQVDSSNSIITLLGNNTGEISSFTTNSNNLPAARQNTGTVTANGYIYVIGGGNSGFQSSVYYAKLNADGSTGSWTTSGNSLPVGEEAPSVVYDNGYIYSMGGTNVGNDVFYTKVNTDGSIGPWITTTVLPDSLYGHTSVVVNGYIYVIGGDDGSSVDTVYYAKPGVNGAITSWSLNSNHLPATRYAHSSITANGYIYVFGGSGGGVWSTVWYAKANSDGTTGTWTVNSNAMPDVRYGTAAVTANGYAYVFGGDDASNVVNNNVYYAKLNSNGSTGTWQSATTTLPATRTFISAATYNGYIYIPGGYSGSSVQNTVYYSPVSRINVGGSLDLVGLAGANLADSGSTGGSLTAADGTFVGSLQVQGQVSFDQSLTIGGNLNSSGSVLFKNSANSTTALQIQDASAVALFGADTTNRIISISGDSTTFANLTLANAHFKSTQTTVPTIGTPTNCGTSPSAAVTAGSTDSAGSFTITAGSGSPTTCDTVFTFNKAYGAAPKSILITPTTTVGSATGALSTQVSGSSSTTFTVKFAPTNPSASQINSFYYWVVE